MNVFTVHRRKYTDDHGFDYYPESNSHAVIMIIVLVIGYTMAKCCDGCRAAMSLFKTRK